MIGVFWADRVYYHLQWEVGFDFIFMLIFLNFVPIVTNAENASVFCSQLGMLRVIEDDSMRLQWEKKGENCWCVQSASVELGLVMKLLSTVK